MTRLRHELGDATPVSALTADAVAAAVTAAWGRPPPGPGTGTGRTSRRLRPFAFPQQVGVPLTGP